MRLDEQSWVVRRLRRITKQSRRIIRLVSCVRLYTLKIDFVLGLIL